MSNRNPKSKPAADSADKDKPALKPGQKVAWRSSQGTLHGKVKRKITAPMKIKGHPVAASPENPEYLVESARTGAVAAHKPSALYPEP
jgi:hypothetical protein